MGNHKQYLAAGAVCAVAIFLLLSHRYPLGERFRGAGANDITQVAAMRIAQERAEGLPVYRVICDGEVVSSTRGTPANGHALRVDLEVAGKHITVWIQDKGPLGR